MRWSLVTLFTFWLTLMPIQGDLLPFPFPPDPVVSQAPSAAQSTYPDEKGFQERCQRVRHAMRTVNLETYRRGYFTGGDPGKYLPGYAMARLIDNPEDEEVRQYLNDDRSWREHYHFAAVQWSRLYPLFGKKVLTPETQKRWAEAAAQYPDYLSPKGTENHLTMWWTSANVLPWYIDKLSGLLKQEALARAKTMLIDYVRTLYFAGQGEWDSSIYWVFTFNGLLNIYDFSQDSEARLWARAGLDWMVSHYALKYTDGIFCAPNQRGYAEEPAKSLTDKVGWLWWGSSQEIPPEELSRYYAAVHAMTTAYRPSSILCNLAQKRLNPLPAEFRNTKPNYHQGKSHQAKPFVYHETFYIDSDFCMGSLQNGFGSQISRFQLILKTTSGPISIFGGHPRYADHLQQLQGLKFEGMGLGCYEQNAQVGPWFISINLLPETEKVDFCFLFLPKPLVTKPLSRTPWIIAQNESFRIGIYPLGERWELTSYDKKEIPQLKIYGRRCGYLLHICRISESDLVSYFTSRQVKVENLHALPIVSWVRENGDSVRFACVGKDGFPGNQLAELLVNQQVVTWEKTITNGPYLRIKDGILRVHDGKKGFQIDVTGDIPVYSEWEPIH